MTWQNIPGPGPESPAQRDARSAWEQGGTTAFPARAADRVTTVLLLAAGALLTIVTVVVAVVAVIAAVASCDAAAGCTPGTFVGGAAIAAGGAFVLGVATVVLAVAAWVRRRRTWWIAALGFVLAIGCVVWGGVVFAQAADGVGSRALDPGWSTSAGR